MKKIYFLGVFACAMLSWSGAKAQVYVSPNSFVYVNDRMVFVKQDIDLQNNGNIYLRNQAQLLQGTTGSGANKGLGKLSVFQEGTVNNFAYNYWCAPVGEPTATATNGSFTVAYLNRPTDVTNSAAATLLGAGVFDGTASPLRIADRWVFRFLSSSTYANWLPSSGSTPSIEPGQGFTMKGSSGSDEPLTGGSNFLDNSAYNNPGSKQRYDFRGKPNDGNVFVTVGAGKRTLTGNPYPSAIDLKLFLNAATGTTKEAYFWEQDPTTNSHLIASYKGGYGTYSPLLGPTVAPYGNMGVYNPPTFYAYDGSGTQLGPTGSGTAFQRRFCPIGQGFMIQGDGVGGTVTMSNNYRVYIKEGFYSDFARQSTDENATGAHSGAFLPPIESVSGFDYTTVSTAEVPQIKFQTLLNNTGVKTVTLVLMDGASDGVELGMEGHSPDQADIDMYFAMENGEYVIDVRQFNLDQKIPVGFKTNVAASFRMKATEFVNFSQADNVYLHDKLTDIYHDIKHTDYEFTLQPGVNNNQYEITFVDALLNTTTLEANAFDVFQSNERQMLNIANPKGLDIKSVALFDLTGKQIFNKTKLGTKTNFEFPTAGLSESIYIVKILTTDDQQYGKKISVYRSK